MKTVADLQLFIRYHIPTGWVGPIREFDFAPLVSEEDFKTILEGKIPVDSQYRKWYVIEAIKKWQRQENIEPC